MQRGLKHRRRASGRGGGGGRGGATYHKFAEEVFVEHLSCRVAVTNLIEVLCGVPAGAVEYDIVSCALARQAEQGLCQWSGAPAKGPLPLQVVASGSIAPPGCSSRNSVTS